MAEGLANSMKRVLLLILILLLSFGTTPLAQDEEVGVAATELGGRPELLQLHVPFTGAWRPGVPELQLGLGDFAELTNMRYADTGVQGETRIQGVSGISAINTTIVDSTYLKIKNGFHFKKDEPAESHVLVQSYNTGLTASKVYENETAIPDAGDFNTDALHTDASGASKGRFSAGPQGTVIYCNEADRPQIWPGDEGKCHSFITSTATIGDTITDPRDFTSRIQNTLQTSEEVVTIGGGDAYSLLLHMDGADEGVLFPNSATSGTITADTIAFVDSDPDTITDSGNGFVTAGFVVGSITVSGSTDNDGTYVVDTVAAGTLTLAVAETLTAEIAGDTVTITMHPVTVGGDAQTDTDQFKFESASCLLDGDGDYLEIPDSAHWYMGTGDFTIDGWFRFADFDNLLDTYTKLQLSGDGIDAATTFTDDGCDGVTMTAAGDAQLDTAQKKFGTASMLFDGTGDYIYAADSASWYMASSPATVDFWIRFNSVAADVGIFNQYEDTDNNVGCYWDQSEGTLILSIADDGDNTILLSQTWAAVVNTWYHVAIVRGYDDDENSWCFLIDGIELGRGPETDSDAWPNIAGPLEIGRCRGISSAYMNGWIDEFRWSKGIARWTAEFTVETSAYPANKYEILWNQQVDADNYQRLFYDACNQTLEYSQVEATSETISVSGSFSPVVDTWYHIALLRGWLEDSETFAICVNGSDVGTTSSESDDIADFAASFDIGKCDDSLFIYFDGWIDEFRVWKGTCAWISDFTPPSREYGAASGYGLIRSPWKLDGVKFYVSSANNVASTLAFEQWTGAAWSALSVSDGTSSDGIALAETGWVTWPSTEDTSEPKFINGYPWYSYQYYLSAGAADVYYVTVSAPMQDITNLWDGTYSTCEGAFSYEATNSQYWNWTDEINSDTTDDVMSLDALEATNDYVLLGFLERQQAIEWFFVAKEENETANTTLAVYYWSGEAWVAVTGLYDGTEVGSISMSRSGVVSWQPPPKSEEFRKSYMGEYPRYYYKFVWDENISASVDVYYIRGIRATEQVLPYKLPLYFQNRTLLLNRNGAPNAVMVSEENAPYIFNGDQSTEIYVGSETDITAAASLSNAYEASIDAVAMLFKDSEIWTLREPGDGGPNFIQQQLSRVIGCPAPLTVDMCEVAPGLNLVYWLSYNGPYYSNASNVEAIRGIEPYFDPLHDLFVGYSALETASGFIDPVLKEYNLLVGDNWLVYDILRNKWFEKALSDQWSLPTCGFRVQDTEGGQYCYLAFDSGYMYRNEYTNAYAGEDIVQVVTLADLFAGSLWNETQLERIKLTVVEKGTNVVTNGDMEDDANWNDYNTPTVNERSTEQVFEGTYSRKFTQATPDTDGIQSDTFTTVIDTEYEISFRIFPVVEDSCRFLVMDGGGGYGYPATTHTGLIPGHWNHITATFTDTAGGDSAYIAIYDAPGGGTNEVFYVDDVSITPKGTIDVYHRGDGDDSWSSLTGVPMYQTGKRYVQHVQKPNKLAVSHQLKMECSTSSSDKTYGMEPVSLDVLYRVKRTADTPSQ